MTANVTQHVKLSQVHNRAFRCPKSDIERQNLFLTTVQYNHKIKK
jgi:hypothetical protein